MSPAPTKLAAAVAGKAALMGGVVASLDITFVKSLILVLVSAGATGVFGVAIAVIQRNETKMLREAIDRFEGRQVDIAGAVGVGKRYADTAAGGEKGVEGTGGK